MAEPVSTERAGIFVVQPAPGDLVVYHCNTGSVAAVVQTVLDARKPRGEGEQSPLHAGLVLVGDVYAAAHGPVFVGGAEYDPARSGRVGTFDYGSAEADKAEDRPQPPLEQGPTLNLLSPLEETIRVFQDGDAVCALVGPDLQEGIAGWGATGTLALDDLLRRLRGQQNGARPDSQAENGDGRTYVFEGAETVAARVGGYATAPGTCGDGCAGREPLGEVVRRHARWSRERAEDLLSLGATLDALNLTPAAEEVLRRHVWRAVS